MKKIVVKPLNILLSLLIILLITSCNQRKKDYVTKFIYIHNSSYSFDSTNHPQININQYFEYNFNSAIKVATGGFNDLHMAPKFGLCNFYNMMPADSFKIMLDKAFCKVAYGKAGKKNLEIFSWMDMSKYCRNIKYNSCFVVETYENKRIKMFFDPDSLSAELKPIYNYVKFIFDKKSYKKANRFEANNALELIQQEIFLYCKTTLPLVELEQKVKFTVPIKIKKDTATIEVKDSLNKTIDIYLDSIK